MEYYTEPLLVFGWLCINLRIEDVDSSRIKIYVKGAKNSKDRYTLLSSKLLEDLRGYWKIYRPEKYLFEGTQGVKYTALSILKIVQRAAQKSKIYKKVAPHTLRRSFAT